MEFYLSAFSVSFERLSISSSLSLLPEIRVILRRDELLEKLLSRAESDALQGRLAGNAKVDTSTFVRELKNGLERTSSMNRLRIFSAHAEVTYCRRR